MKKRIMSLVLLMAILCSMALVVSASSYQVSIYCPTCSRVTTWNCNEAYVYEKVISYCNHCGGDKYFDEEYLGRYYECTSCGKTMKSKTLTAATCRACGNPR